MYKFIILIISLGLICLTYFVAKLLPIESINPENLKIQLYFIYGAEGLFGLLLSGILCLGKNEFEAYHIAQVCIGIVYMIIEICCIGLVFIQMNENTILIINATISFFLTSPLLLMILANYKTKRIN